MKNWPADFALALFLIFGLTIVFPANASSPITTGLIVVDGDTVKTVTRETTYYRLQGYDTPEIEHAKCDKEKQLGNRAKLRMQQIIIEGDYKLVNSGKKDKYRRDLATLYSHGVSTDQIFIKEGLAVAYFGKGPKYDWCAN